MYQLIRRAAAAIAALTFILMVPSGPRAQAVPAIDKRITYILPLWGPLPGVTDQEVSREVDELRRRLGPDGPRVKLGFNAYVDVRMFPVDPTDVAAVRAGLEYTFEQVDGAIARARAANIPISLTFLTQIRTRVDPLQERAQMDDRRNMQWHGDQSRATGWVTFSRYARKLERVEEAFIRELGRGLAARMLAYPEIFVAASGDGEVELSHMKSPEFFPDTELQIADYSPFAIAEFRDWLRGTGLYGPGQPFAGQAYRNSARYTSDASLALLNADFGQTFATWNLKHFDWSLADDPDADPRAIPATLYTDDSVKTVPADYADGFDAPRVLTPGDPWFDVWTEFRQTMVWRHNLEFAKWITTSPDPATGATVPPDRWFTDQVPADYLFGNTPANLNDRLMTSASPHWTADVSPYGSLGITSFNAYHENIGVFRTLAGVAPAIAQRKVRWGIFEWSPSVPEHPDVAVYREDMALVERYRPSVLVPFYWKNPDYPIEDTGFETALRELIARIRVIPLTLSRTSLVAGATTTGDGRTPPQTVRVSGAPGETPPWTVTAASPFLEVTVAPDGRSFTVTPRPMSYAPGTQGGSVTISSSDPGYSPVTLNVTLNVTAPGASAAPVGSFDTPAELQVVTGELGITGWAVDDMGVKSVDIYRSPLAGEPTQPNGLIYLGTASLVEGARPDVQAQFPGIPLTENAGWGYMLLSNFLPNNGTGIFTLHALVTDVDGHTSNLGSRRIDARNGTATVPFGTIDTPGQGQTVSGTVVNFGWVLTPNPTNCIPSDGSTIDVVIDGVVVGHPVYNNRRDDIATLFPGLCNSNGAIGYFMINTTTLSNGVHTISWVARDSAGGAVGLGSRYFTVLNP